MDIESFTFPINRTFWQRKTNLALINEEKLSRMNINGKFVPVTDMVKIGEMNGKFVIFSPLLLKVYLMEKSKWENLLSGKIEENLSLFLNNRLICPKGMNLTEYRKYMHVNISLTDDCNLGCVYCVYNSGETKNTIDLGFVKSYLDYISENYKNVPTGIRFFGGGEPTLKFKLMKKIYDYAFSRVDTPVFQILSNGTFSKKVCNWIIKNIDEISLSYDGLPELQNTQRPFRSGSPSSGIVERNIKRITISEKNLSIHVVLTKNTASRTIDVLNNLNSLGVRRIGIMRLILEGRAKERDMVENQGNFLNEILPKMREIAGEMGIRIFCGPVEFEKPIDCMCPSDKFMHLTAKNEIIHCGRLKNYTESVKSGKLPFLKGRYDEKNKKITFTDEAGYLATRNIHHIDECRKCVSKWLCGGGCPFVAMKMHNDVYKPGSKCETTIRFMKDRIMEESVKKFIRIRPYIEKEKPGKIYYTNSFNKIQLSRVTNNQHPKGSNFITIDDSCDFKKLSTQILSERNKDLEVKLFLLSFQFSNKWLSHNFETIYKFLKTLKSNRIYFRVTKPFPKCIYEKTDYKELCTEMHIPGSCEDCLELYEVQGERIRLCNGKIFLLKDFENRNAIYRELEKCRNLQPACKKCRHFLRKQCGGFCLNLKQ